MSKVPEASPMRLVVLISGGGTTLKNLLDTIAAGKLNAEVVLVISSNRNAPGLKIAETAGVATKVIERKASRTPQAYSKAIFEPCRAADASWVVMGGFLTHVLIPPDFVNRVLNIHPALIPNFCGKGFFGRHVHEAVIKSGAKYSGCTVHFVDDVYDHGPIILQKVLPVVEGDTPDTLAERVFQAECEAYPEALQMLAQL